MSQVLDELNDNELFTVKGGTDINNDPYGVLTGLFICIGFSAAAAIIPPIHNICKYLYERYFSK